MPLAGVDSGQATTGVSALRSSLPVTSKAERPRVRLEYLEGLRGLAALYVVLHHVYMDLHYRQVSAAYGGGVPTLFLKAFKFLDFGHYAVDVFIVLSGYCLMLPVASSADGALRGGIISYLQRRARRILPPYYAALILSLIAVPLVRLIEARAGIVDAAAVNLVPHVVIAHLLLIHNLVPGWGLFTNPPLWSVATEWQIYFFFPALLVIWRRTGMAAAILLAFTLGLAPHYLLHGFLDSAYPWYLGLFALGMAGALIGFTNQPSMQAWRERIPWGKVSGVLWAGLGIGGIVKPGWYADHRWLADPVFGLATLCLLVFCTGQLHGDHPIGRFSVLRLLDAPFSRVLGSFSYSLYLVHYPLITLFGVALVALHAPPIARIIALFGVGVPSIVALAYAFYVPFERPFVSARRETKRV